MRAMTLVKKSFLACGESKDAFPKNEGAVLRQLVIRRADAWSATWNGIFSGTISGARRSCPDRDWRRIGDHLAWEA